MPASDCGDALVGIGEPLEGFRVRGVIAEEAIDRGLEVGDGSEDASLKRRIVWGVGISVSVTPVDLARLRPLIKDRDPPPEAYLDAAATQAGLA
jgi:hypothetical protein